MKPTLSHFVAALACGITSSAVAQLDTEPTNNTQAGADILGLGPMQARLNLAGLGVGGGDRDFYSNQLLIGETLVTMTTPLGGQQLSSPDTVLGGFSPSGVLGPVNDDAGTDRGAAGGTHASFGSAVRYRATGSGMHASAVTGFPDFGFTGAHSAFGPYALTVARFPANPVVGGDFADSPGNNIPAGADSLNLSPGSAVNAVASLTGLSPGDVDFYSVMMAPGNVLSAITTPLGVFGAVPDTLLGLFDPAGNLVFFNDDAGTDFPGGANLGFGSVVRFTATAPGQYYLGVTGFQDPHFTGGHPVQGTYGLTVSLIPAPASPILLALGLLGAARGRRVV